MIEPAIEGRGVTRVYSGGVPVTALADIHVSVSPGQVVALEGPSGSGKSTLLGLLGLLDRPTAGQISVHGRNTDRLSDAERSRLRGSAIGFVFQQFNLIPHLSAVDNVACALLYRHLRRHERRMHAEAVLHQVGLGKRLAHLPQALSGGEQQRVALARAVVAAPAVILADEPTGNLDSHSARNVLEVLTGFASKGVAIVMATHDRNVAAMSDRRLRMRDGRLVGDG